MASREQGGAMTENEENCFFVCLHIESGSNGDKDRLIKIGTNISNNFDVDTAEKNDAPQQSSFKRIFDEFREVMLGYMEMLPVLAAVPSTMMGTFGLRGLLTFLEHIGSEVAAPAGQRRFKIPYEKYSLWENFSVGRRTASLVARQLPKMLLIGVVSALEHYEALAIAECLRIRPEKYLSRDRSVSLSEIIDIGSIDELKNSLLDRDVNSIMRENATEQMRKIEAILESKESISANYEKWNELIEIMERRNLFAHSNGIVNDIYIRNTKKLNAKFDRRIGEELFVTSKYFEESLDNVFEFGCNLIQVMWRKMAPDEQKAADDRLGTLGYSLIERGKYSLAVRVLKLAGRMRGKKEEYRRRMDVVNLANAYRLLGSQLEANATLDAEDWSIVDDAFKVSVSAVRGNVEQVVQLIKMWSPHERVVGMGGFETWPVFYGIRDTEAFKAAFKERFGRDMQPVPMIRNSVMEALQQVDQLLRAKADVTGLGADAAANLSLEDIDILQ